MDPARRYPRQGDRAHRSPYPGVAPVVSLSHPVVVVRMAVGDAYGAAEGRDGEPGARNESAWRTERIDRSVCQSVAEFAFVTAATVDGLVYGGPKWTVSAIYEGMLKEEMDAAARRHPNVAYHPMLIDAAYAGLMTEQWDQSVVIPTLNRDGDCLSDLVLAMFGSIAGAESVLLALDDNLNPMTAMAEAPHGTAPSLEGKNVANPMAMLLACAAVLEHAGIQATVAPRKLRGRFDTRRSPPPWTASAASISAGQRPPRGRRRGRRSNEKSLTSHPLPSVTNRADANDFARDGV